MFLGILFLYWYINRTSIKYSVNEKKPLLGTVTINLEIWKRPLKEYGIP